MTFSHGHGRQLKLPSRDLTLPEGNLLIGWHTMGHVSEDFHMFPVSESPKVYRYVWGFLVYSMAQQGPPGSGRKVSRRDFLKLMAAAGTIVTFIPFIDWGKYLPNPTSNVSAKAQVQLPDGSQANVKTFPVNHSESVIYPKTNDQVLNQESFRLWQFIRLPEELGGARNDVSAFRMYSQVCLHLWCLWKYWPDPGRKRGECPCHGSMYDPLNGKAFAGPASLQSPPSNVLPMLDLEVDGSGNLWILPPNWSPNGNGIVGFGRFLKE